MLEESLNSLNTDEKVHGVVVGIAPNEVYVDVGRKQAGFIPVAELSACLLYTSTVQGAELQGGARILARNVLVACGGVSYPGTGSTGDGYALSLIHL